MNKGEYFAFYVGITMLVFVIFYPFKGDMTMRFVTLCVSTSLQSYAIADIRARRIINAVCAVLTVLIFILGFGFSYFK